MSDRFRLEKVISFWFDIKNYGTHVYTGEVEMPLNCHGFRLGYQTVLTEGGVEYRSEPKFLFGFVHFGVINKKTKEDGSEGFMISGPVGRNGFNGYYLADDDIVIEETPKSILVVNDDWIKKVGVKWGSASVVDVFRKFPDRDNVKTVQDSIG